MADALSTPLSNLYLVVAQECNLACRYCYAGGGSFGLRPERMAHATMVLALERLLPLAGPHLTVSFFGGEPLLNFPLVTATVARARKLAAAAGKDVSFALTTNGTVLDGAMADFLAEHIHHLAVSLDGDRLANAGRPFLDGRDSLDTVLTSLAELRRRAIPFGLRATVTPENVGRVLESAAFLSGLGASSVRLLPAHGIPWPGPARKALREAMAELNYRGLAALLEGTLAPGCETLLRMVAHRLEGQAATRPCLAGVGVLAVGADGTVYPCEHFVGVDDFAMGQVSDQDFPGAAFQRVARRFQDCTVDHRPRCSRCELSGFCGGQCYAEAHAASGHMEIPDAAHCGRMVATASAVGPELDRVMADGRQMALLRATLGL